MNPFRAPDFDSADLTDWGVLSLPLAQPLGAPMPHRGIQQWAAADGKTSTGTWECEPGLSRWEFTTNGEFIHILAGSMIVRPDEGAAVTLVAGDSMTFAPGWVGTWEITTTLRKVYTIFPV